VRSLTAIAFGLLQVGTGANTSGSLYQVERADSALGGGRRGEVPPQEDSLAPQEDGANTARSPYQVGRADSDLGGGRRGVAPPQEDGLPPQERQ
jgi:hypothetical protein